MFGFMHNNKFDADGAVTIRAVKIMLRESIPKQTTVMNQRIEESFASVLDKPLQQQASGVTLPVFTFAKEILLHPAVQVLYGSKLGT